MPPKQHPPEHKPFLLAPYIFGIQSIPLLASGIYTLLFPAAAATLPNSPMQGLSNGTIQALRYILLLPVHAKELLFTIN